MAPLLKFFATPLFHRYFWWKTGHLRTCRPFFCSFLVKNKTFEDVWTFFSFSDQSGPDNSSPVVEDIELDPSNNPVREGFRLSTCGPSTEEVAHPCSR